MTINRGFNLSASVISTEPDVETGGSTTLVDSYDIYAAVSTGPIESDSDELGLVLNGEALAVGENTYTAASAEATITNASSASSAEASLTTTSAAASPGQTLASSSSSIGLIGGAEYSFSLNSGTAIMDQDSGQTTSSSSSTAYLYALTINDPVFVEPPSTPDQTYVADTTFSEPGPEPEIDCGCGSGSDDWLDGNVALFDIDLDVYSEDSYIGLDVYAFTVEDQLSNVTINSILLGG